MSDDVYDKVVERFEVDTVVADAGYKTPWICKKIIDDGRNPSMPYKRPGGKKGFFRPKDFVYDEYYNCMLCPHDQVLPYVTTTREGYRQYKSDPEICRACPDLAKCTQSRSCQKVVLRHLWADYVEQAEDFRHTAKGKKTYSMRGETIERVFADAKEKHAMRYTHHRGLTRVRNWVRLKFAAMNLKKLAIWAFRRGLTPSFFFRFLVKKWHGRCIHWNTTPVSSTAEHFADEVLFSYALISHSVFSMPCCLRSSCSAAAIMRLTMCPPTAPHSRDVMFPQ